MNLDKDQSTRKHEQQTNHRTPKARIKALQPSIRRTINNIPPSHQDPSSEQQGQYIHEQIIGSKKTLTYRYHHLALSLNPRTTTFIKTERTANNQVLRRAKTPSGTNQNQQSKHEQPIQKNLDNVQSKHEQNPRKGLPILLIVNRILKKNSVMALKHHDHTTNNPKSTSS